MKSYTNIEQSKKLAEILPGDSADMCWGICNETLKYKTMPYLLPWRDYTAKELYLPCWSLATLLNILPSEFTEKYEYSETTYKIDIRKYALTDDVYLYQIAYGNYKFYEDGNHSWKDIVNTGEKENLLDAAFQMICWLKKNGKI